MTDFRSVNLTILKGNDGVLVDSLIDKSIAERFKFGLANLEVSNVKDFIESLEKKFPNLDIAKFVLTKKGNTFFHVLKKESVEYISENVTDMYIFINVWKKNKGYVEIYTKTPKELEFVYSNFEDFFLEGEGFKIQLHSYYIDNGLKYDMNTISEEDLNDISSDFYPDFKSTDLFFKTFLNAKENIVVLSGEPGVGKSKFSTLALKYAIQNGEQFIEEKEDKDSFVEEDNNINVAYVKNEKILALDTFWINLRKFDYKFIILDDLDYFLSQRDQTINSEAEELKNQFISHFLSYSDGLLPNKTKFIITTNRKIDGIDEALLRDGRMFGVYSFSKLSYKEALSIWIKNDLPEKAFKSEFSDSEKNILQSTLGSKIYGYKANGDKRPSDFLKDGSTADISSKYIKERRVGII